MIKAIIFDIGGVLYKSRMEDFYCHLEQILNLKNNSISCFFKKNIDKLLLGNKSFFDLIKELNINISEKEFEKKAKQAWHDIFIINTEVLKLINHLKLNFKVSCVSNAFDFNVIMDKETCVNKLFNPYINSCEVKLKKPDEKIFQLILNKLNFKANECVYTDDKIENLKVSKTLGFKVLLFENANKLKKDLNSLDISL